MCGFPKNAQGANKEQGKGMFNNKDRYPSLGGKGGVQGWSVTETRRKQSSWSPTVCKSPSLRESAVQQVTQENDKFPPAFIP